MIECAAWSSEATARCEPVNAAFQLDRTGCRFIQGVLADVLQPAHVDALEAERVRTRLFRARNSVALSQTEELLRLAQLWPRLDSTQQLLGECAEVGSEKT